MRGVAFAVPSETIRSEVWPAIPAGLGNICPLDAANFAGKRPKMSPSDARNSAYVWLQEKPLSHWQSYVLHR